MNWGIRIASILLITGGLLWLNWDRLSGESIATVSNDLPAFVFEKGEDQSEVSRVRRDTEPNQDGSGEYSPNLAKSTDKGGSASLSKKPDVVLQASPESLNESDTQVRSVAEEIFSDAIEWLKPEEQLRKWTLLVTQAAEGNTLYSDRPFTFSLAGFAVEERDERYFVSTQNFERYERVVNVLVNMQEDKLVAYYRAWYPLLEQAFGELGLPGSFDEQVDIMIERILAVEVLVPPIELKKPTSVTYKFLDPKLEDASQIDKWLWRMGPENTRQIQGLAYRLKQALEKN